MFDIFKKKADGQVADTAAIQGAIQETCSNLTVYCRDADLPDELMHKYQRGMIIRERGFVDTTAMCGGIIKSHRYMILSNHMVPMLPFEDDKQWALCVANKDSRFLVLGKAKGKGKRVTVLLHLKEDSWRLFRSVDMEFSRKLTESCFQTFAQCMEKAPIPSVSTPEWFDRCQFPLGMSDQGECFPLED